MPRICPQCQSNVEPNATTCSNGHPQPPAIESATNIPGLSGSTLDFRPTSAPGPKFALAAPDIGYSPDEGGIKSIVTGELPTRARPIDNLQVPLPSGATDATRPAEYMLLDKFCLPEDEPPLVPLAVQIGQGGIVHVLDAGQPNAFRWVRFSPTGKVVQSTTITREPAGPQAPAGIALDAADRLYIADLGAGCVWRYENNGVTVAIGQGELTGGLLDVTLDQSGNLFVAESSACRITKLDPSGAHILSYGSPDRLPEYAEEEEEEETEVTAGPPAPDRLSNPSAVAVDTVGNIYIADTSHQRVLKLDAAGTFVGLVAQGVELFFPSGLQVSPTGDLFVADLDGSRIHKFAPSGPHLFSLAFESGTVGGEFAVDNDGNLYLPSKSAQAILKVRHTG